METQMSTVVHQPHVSRHRAELTADEARKVTFPPSTGWRGYAEDKVDEFVARVADTLAAAEREYAAMRAEIDRLRAFYREHGTDVDNATERRPARPRRRGGYLVGGVERYTGKYVALAAEYAEVVVDYEHGRADEHLYHARIRARTVVTDLIEAFLADPHNRSRAEAELRRLAGWLWAFGEAVWTQSDAMARVAEQEFRTVASGQWVGR
jgi:DivIVA domain-containing protein